MFGPRQRSTGGMEDATARRSQSPVLEAHRSSLPAAAPKAAVEDVQQQIQQQRKIIDRCKAENHALRGELDSRTKVSEQDECLLLSEAPSKELKCMLCLQREPYLPSTSEQDKLAHLTDLIDVFTRKV